MSRPHWNFPVDSDGQVVTIDVLQPYNVAGVIGSVFWVIVYFYAIRQGFRDRTYSIPQYAVCLNFGWEILGSFVLLNPITPWHFLERAWFVLDIVIVWQVLRFGKQSETVPELRRFHTPIILLGIAAACIGQWTFIRTFSDTLGFEIAFLIDFVMSILFVFMFFERRDTSRDTWLIAWLKLLGNAGVSIQSMFFLAALHPEKKDFTFFYFLFAGVFLFDVIYVSLLHGERKRTGSVAAMKSPT